MNYKYQYDSEDERQALIIKYKDKVLIQEQNITEGNFLIFSDAIPEAEIVYVNVPEEEFETLKQENTLLKAQSQANSDRADFHEEVLAEIILSITP